MTAYYYDKDHVIKRAKADGLHDVIFKKPIDPSRLLRDRRRPRRMTPVSRPAALALLAAYR